ncbi:DUF7507 domain-containing protein [Paracoccus lichenicola]|uniref:DUF7507 domain-containing protein n=1 Tax=Paracoccus lichenicola TaxID=2665644 RepID=UPI0018A9EFB7|nr:SdrD B-like domain-containing protein [Paracoccus lichenicola]
MDWLLNVDDTASDPVPAGGLVEYRITVFNDGFDPAPATILDLSIPSGMRIESVGNLTGCSPVPVSGPRVVTCPIPALAAQGSLSLVARLRSSTQGTTQLTASIPVTAGGVTDVQTTNNSVTEQTTVTAGADIQLRLNGPATAVAGSTVSYTFQATNNGPDPAASLTLRFPVPTGLGNVAPPTGCTLAGGVYQCAITGPIPVGGSVTRVFTAQVGTASGSTITAAGSVLNVSPPDPLAGNSAAQMNTTVSAGSDLAISKARSGPDPILVGDAVTFTLTPRYSGDVPQTITVTDTLPGGYRIDSVSAPGWGVAVAGQTVTATQASGTVPGSNVALGPITIAATAIGSGPATNTAAITATGPVDPNTANNTASDGGATIQEPQVDLLATKSGPSPALYVVGNSYDFRLGARNVGNAPFAGRLVMTDSLPAGLTATAVTANGWSCSPALPLAGPATLTCTRSYGAGAPLAAGAAAPTVVVTAEVTADGPIQNLLSVASPDLPPEPNTANNTAGYSGTAATGPDSADIRVEKSAALPSVGAGDVQDFTIVIRNDGPVTARDVLVTDLLTGLVNADLNAATGGMASYSVDTNAGGAGDNSAFSCSTAAQGGNARQLQCVIDTVPPCGVSDCPRIQVGIRPGGAAGGRTNTATAVSTTTPDPNDGNNAGTASYAVTPKADVAVDKIASPSPLAVGQVSTYVVTARNLANGLSAADHVTITDTLPAGMTFVSATPSAGTCAVQPAAETDVAPGNDTVSCDLGTINNGAQRTVSIRMRPNLGLEGTTVVNAVTVSTTTAESAMGNNSFQLSSPVRDPEVSLLVNKTDTVDPVPLGDATDYVIRVTNTGPSIATNVAITDQMPGARITYQGHVLPAGGSCASVPGVGALGGTLECGVPRVNVGQTVEFRVTGGATAKGVAVNRVTVTSNETARGFEPNLADNLAVQNTTARTRADLEIVQKTASPATVNLRDPFDFLIDLRNNTGAGLSEADDVVLTDSLPSGIELTGTPTIAVLGGTAGQTACTGGAGSTSFTCNLGTLGSGALVRITAPSRVTSVTTTGQIFTNTASVTTQSLDVVPANNTNSGSVTVNASSLAGRIFRDFNADALPDPTDQGLSGVTVTLTGTAFDGTPVNRTATTTGAGAYSFTALPEGTYRISHAAIAEARLTNGTTTAGGAGGTPAPTSIASIALPPATPSDGYLFPKIPLAQIGIAKQIVAAPVINPDGTFTAGFRLRVRNFSREPLDTVRVTDPLSGAAPRFGSAASLANPLTDPLAPGSYAITAAPSGSCGGGNSGFDGAGDPVVATGVTLAAGATCDIQFALRARPTVPLPPVLPSGGNYENLAAVTGEGAYSRQDSTGNPDLADLSDNGATAIPGSSSPTPVAPAFLPRIALVKTADVSGLSSPPRAGDAVSYDFTVTNTGNLTLTNVVVTDPLLGGAVGSPIPTLAAGASQAVRAPYTLTQADLDAGRVENTAVTQGDAPDGSIVTDTSGATLTDDDPTEVPIAPAPSIALVKAADASALSSPAQAGDVISYDLTVTNTGNVTLSNVVVNDPLLGGAVGSAIATLAPGATGTVSATYALTQADLDAGEVVNTATAQGTPPSGGPVTDTSGTTTADDDPTEVPITPAPSIALVKAADASGFSLPAQAGDVVSYDLTVTNTGNVTLTNVVVNDPLLGGAVGSPIATLAPGATGTVSATYALTQADLDAGEVFNTATAQGTPPTGGPVTDTSGATTADDDPTEVPITPAPSIALVKVANASGLSTPAQVGDVISFDFTVTNTGNVTLSNVVVNDPLLGGAVGSAILALAPGASGSMSATYALTQTDLDAGEVVNTATAQGTPPTGGPVTDTSGTTTTDDDPTQVPITPVPSIALVKAADVSGLSAPAQAGDPIAYGFTVTNTGNVTLTNVTVTDPLLGGAVGSPIPTLAPGASQTVTAPYPLTVADLDAGVVVNSATAQGTPPGGGAVTDISGTTVADDNPTQTPLVPAPAIALVKTADVSGLSAPAQAGDLIAYGFTVTNTGNVTMSNVVVNDPLLGGAVGSAIPTLAPGASETVSATYPLTQADLDAGLVVNTATAQGTPPTGGPVTDISGATLTDDDPTEATLVPAPAIALVKTADASALSVPVHVGELVSYDFTVTNTGNVTLSNVVVNDPLLGGAVGSPIPTLAPGASGTVTAAYPLTQADLDAARVVNSATAQGTPPTGGAVTDTSGTTITDNDPTETPLVPAPAIALVKTADASAVSAPAQLGELISYGFTVTNTGNVTLSNVTLTDPLLGGAVGSPIPTLAPGASGMISATHALTQADLDAGQVVNTATATGTPPRGGPVTDTSGATVADDDPTTVPLVAAPAIALVKTADGSGIAVPAAPGDPIAYSFTVTNTGTVTLLNVTLADALQGAVVSGGPIPALAPGAVDSGTFTATYPLQQADIDAGRVVNSATATGTTATGTAVSDISGSGALTDDPTEVAITPAAGIVLVKSLTRIEDANGNGADDAGDVVHYAFALTNTGNVALRVPAIADPRATVSGGPAVVAPGQTDSGSFTARLVLTQDDLDRGHVDNSATVTAAAVRGDGGAIAGPGGAPLTASDISDAGTDPEGAAVPTPGAAETPDGAGGTDGDPGNDPTVARLTRAPGIALIKSHAGYQDANGNKAPDAGDVLRYAFTVTNTGNVALRIDRLDDPIATVAGGPVVLQPGQSDDRTFTATYALTDRDMVRGHVQNSATVRAPAVARDGSPVTDRDGTPLEATDVSDAGTDPDGARLDDPQAVETPDGQGGTDGDPANDPTVVTLGRPEILLRITITDTPDRNGNGIFDAGDLIVYAFAVTNTGNVLLENVTIDPASLNLDLPGFSCRPIRLEVGETATLVCQGNRYTVTARDAAQGAVRLTATAIGDSVSGVRASSDSGIASPTMEEGGLSVVKTADRGTALAGDLVGYTLAVTNEAGGIATATTLVDSLPPGFTYQSGSARLDGAAAEPEIAGNRLVWRGLDLAAGQTRRIAISVLVGGGVQPGAHVNRAQAFSPATGRPVSPEAQATIRVEVDAVFACSTVIGRVFDDGDHDGHFNGEPDRGRGARGAANLDGPPGTEKGLPGVRLVTPDGVAVTTDEHGRFSLPCAALPRDIGANVMLKLDERTLPLGYRLTTENPRVVRVTPGMLTKMNFGATLSRVVRVDLSARAFGAGGAARPELQAGLRQLVAQIADTPAVLRISYQLAAGEDRATARARIRQVETALRRLWPANGRYALTIEAVVQARAGTAGAGGR